jgi:hypothetical protein
MTPPNKRARPTGARRPQGAVTPPAQRRRRQEAIAATARSGKRPAAQAASRARSTPEGLTRDKLLGYGATVAAVLALASLSLPGTVYLVGLGYLAYALLGPADKRDWRLRFSGWAFAVLLMITVLVSIGAAVRFSRLTPDDPGSLVYLSMGVTSMILSMVLMTITAVAGVLVGLAFTRQGSARHRLLSWAGLAMIFYYVLLLPNAVVDSSAPPALGAFWAAPLVYGSILLGMMASAVVTCAFLWTASAETPAAGGGARHFGLLHREYLLLVGAFSLFLPNIIYLLSADWSVLRQRSDETLSQAAYAGIVLVSSLLYLLVLFAAATVAFWFSCRRLGWKPGRWLAAPPLGAARDESAPAAAAPKGAEPAVVDADLTSQPRVPLAWAQRFLLSWRLTLTYAWFIVLVAACSFLGWYGFAAAVPAAAHYLWMLRHDGKRNRRVARDAGATGQ